MSDAPSKLVRTLLLMVTLVAVLAGCTIGSSDSSDTGSAPTTEAAPVAKVTASPADAAVDVSPTAPVSLTVADGTLQNVALTNADGTVVAGALNSAGTVYTATEPLGYGAIYKWTGTAMGADGKAVPVAQSFTTVTPASRTSVNTNIGDGQAVGVAAPIILKFDDAIVDKAAVEKALTVTTNPPTTGAWAWLPDDGGSRVHWRPQNYWVPGTTVEVDAKLYGVNYGDGAYGDSDVTLDFTIGASQVVKADATSHRMQVVRDGETVMDIPVSYGEGNEDRNVTRSGIHVVTEQYEDIHMSNPPYYTDAHERWATRISNNGEFIHANPLTTGVQGSSNVTNGCINLSTSDAEEYFHMANYGDPVEVTGTRIDLSAADGDIYDWAIDWPTWLSMSEIPAGSAATTPAATTTAAPTTTPSLVPANG